MSAARPDNCGSHPPSSFDRLARLVAADWQLLRAEVDSRRVRIVALDLPTSWALAAGGDEFTGRMLAAVNGMLLDMLAAIARKVYFDRRRRQAEGTAKARAAGLYKGRPADDGRNEGIATMLRAGSSWQQVRGAFGCSRDTIARVKGRWPLRSNHCHAHRRLPRPAQSVHREGAPSGACPLWAFPP